MSQEEYLLRQITLERDQLKAALTLIINGRLNIFTLIESIEAAKTLLTKLQ